MTQGAREEGGAVRAGIGWRAPHHRTLLEQRPPVGFLEIHAENHMGGGQRRAMLEAARRDYPVSIYGVGLSLGSVAPVDDVHLDALAALVAAIDPVFVSEHVAWCRLDGIYLNDLLPLPYTEEALAVLVRNIDRVQTRLKRPILMENPSTYLAFAQSTIAEGPFLAEIARRSGCLLLLDVNNLYVNERNHGYAARETMAALDPETVAEIHLAGHHVADLGDATLLIDDHGSAVSEPVWELYREASLRFPQARTLVEWDSRIPSLDLLLAEAAKADHVRVLADLQRDFARAIREEAPAAAPGIAAAGLTAARRVAVYRNHHRMSLAAALAANFPTVVGVVGAEAFQALAISFVATDPPGEPCLGAYGAGFAAFLETDPRARTMPYLGDVARLDWAFNRADQAVDAVAFTADRLAGLDEEQLEALVIAPHPSMALLRSPYPLLRIRTLARRPEEEGGISLDEGGVRLMIWRRDGAVTCANLDYQTDAFVAALATGSSLGRAAKQIDPAALPDALAGYVLGGAFVATG